MRLLLLAISIALSVVSFGQSKVNEVFEDTPLTEVLSIFEEKYGMKLAYDPDLVKQIRITANLSDLEAEQALKKVFEHTELSFDKVKKNYFTIRPSNHIWAFTATIKDEFGMTVPYAKVRIVGTYKGTYADADGLVKFEYRSDATPQLQISSLGLKDMIISAEDIEDGGSIEMKSDFDQFEEVLVEYLTEGISLSEDVSKITIHPKKIGTVPGATEPDVFQMVQNIPGINSASSTVSEIQIRGGTADQNQLMWMESRFITLDILMG